MDFQAFWWMKKISSQSLCSLPSALSISGVKWHRSFTEIKWLLGFFVAAVLLWGISLGDLPLRDWDEGTRALIAREIYRTGNWIYPTLQGQPYLLKPPLMDWLIALSYQLGGVNEFTTRLPGAFFSAGAVPLLYLVGRELFQKDLISNWDDLRYKTVVLTTNGLLKGAQDISLNRQYHISAVFAAGVYLTLLPVVRHGRLAMLDGMIVSLFLLLVLCLLKARDHRLWGMGIGICWGLIILTKGIMVMLLGAIAFLFLWANQQLILLRSRYFWIGMLLGNTPVLVWYIAQWQHYGAMFWQVHVQAQGLARISQPVEGNSGSPGYYLWDLLKYTWPWLLFWPGGLRLAWQNRRRSWGSLVLIGTVCYLGAISLMKTKLSWYIMPLYPFLALAVSVQLTQLWNTRRNYGLILVRIFGVIAVAGLGGCVYFYVADRQLVLIFMGLLVSVIMGVVAGLIKIQSRIFMPILFIGMYLVLGLLMTSKSWIWELNEAFPVKPVAALIRAHTPPNTVVYTSFEHRRPSLDFYSDRQVLPAPPQALLQLSSSAYLLLDQTTLTTFKLANNQVIGTAEGFSLVAPSLVNNQ